MILCAQPRRRCSEPTSQTPLICHTDGVITESAPPPGSREDQRQEEPKQPQPVDPRRKSGELLFAAAPSPPRHRLRRDDGRAKNAAGKWRVRIPLWGQRTAHRALCTRAPAATLCAHHGVNSALTLTCCFFHHHLSPLHLCSKTKSNPFLALDLLPLRNYFCKL